MSRRDDLISRQAAIDAVDTWIKLYVLSRTMAAPMSIQEMISALPSAQPDKTYEQGWKDGREALRKEMWEDGRDRLN